MSTGTTPSKPPRPQLDPEQLSIANFTPDNSGLLLTWDYTLTPAGMQDVQRRAEYRREDETKAAGLLAAQIGLPFVLAALLMDWERDTPLTTTILLSSVALWLTAIILAMVIQHYGFAMPSQEPIGYGLVLSTTDGTPMLALRRFSHNLSPLPFPHAEPGIIGPPRSTTFRVERGVSDDEPRMTLWADIKPTDTAPGRSMLIATWIPGTHQPLRSGPMPLDQLADALDYAVYPYILRDR